MSAIDKRFSKNRNGCPVNVSSMKVCRIISLPNIPAQALNFLRILGMKLFHPMGVISRPNSTTVPINLVVQVKNSFVFVIFHHDLIIFNVVVRIIL